MRRGFSWLEINSIGPIMEYFDDRSISFTGMTAIMKWLISNPFEIISLQTTRKKNNWKTEEKLARTVVTLETERIKGSIP